MIDNHSRELKMRIEEYSRKEIKLNQEREELRTLKEQIIFDLETKME